MSVRQPAFSKAEFTHRGTSWYERLRSEIEPGNIGRIVAIDILTGQYAIDDDTLAASDKLLACHPDAQTWFVRIGHDAVHRFGPRTWHDPS